MVKKFFPIGIPIFIALLVLGVSFFLFKSRYDKTIETRKMENAVRDAARAGVVSTSDVGVKLTKEETPVESSIDLSIISPSNGTEVTSPTITVRGKTVPGADVFVNEQESIAGPDGIFKVMYTLEEGENILLIVVADADGNASEEELKVFYDTGDQNTGGEINRVVIVEKETNSIQVKDTDGGTVPVMIDGNTVLRRRYWGKAGFDEFQIGDIVTVYGKWTDDEKTKLTARFIRNWSNQKRNGVFFGTVASLIEKGWVLETKRGNQTVISGGSITNRRGDVIGRSDVLISHRIRVKGLWDRSLNTITDVSGVKDYTLPLKVTATPGN